MSLEAQSFPDLSSEYSITEAHIAEYQEKGHLYLPNVLTQEEVSAWREVFRGVIQKHYPNPKPLEERDVFNKAFLSLSNTWHSDPITQPFIFGRRFSKIAADLMGQEALRVYHNQVFYKESGGGPTPWHQDHYYWPVDTIYMTTI